MWRSVGWGVGVGRGTIFGVVGFSTAQVANRYVRAFVHLASVYLSVSALFGCVPPPVGVGR